MAGDDTQINVYKVQMYVEGTENDAQALRKSLSQSVYEDFEMTEGNAVFGVTVELDNLPTHEYVMALCMVGLEDGLDTKQIIKILNVLPCNGKFLPIEFATDNSVAIGFINAEFYELHNYDPVFVSDKIIGILGNMELESPNGIYETPDGRKFCMSYFND